MPCRKFPERWTERKPRLPAEGENGFGGVTEGSDTQIQGAEFARLNISVTFGGRLTAVGNESKGKPLNHLRHEAVNHFGWQVLENVFDDQQICLGHVGEAVRRRLESYVFAAICGPVLFNHGFGDIEAEVINTCPVHQARKLPITAPEVNRSPDTILAHKVLHEPPIPLSRIRQRTVTGAKTP